MTRRLRSLVIGIVVVFATGAVAIGFRTGWLSITERGREVGRLRPADLVVTGEEISTGNETRASEPTTVPVASVDGTAPVTPDGSKSPDTYPQPDRSRPPPGDHHGGGRGDDD